MNNEKMRVDYQIMHTAGTNPYAVLHEGVTLIASNVVSRYFLYNYGSFECSDFYAKFELYNAMQAGDLSKALEAWNSTYNPLENYNGIIERLITDDHGDETKTHKTGGDDGTHNTITNAAIDGTSTTHKVSTDESPNFRNETQDTQTGGTETTDNLHTEDKTTHGTTSRTVGNDTITADTIHTEKEEKHGNLGVTTSQQMIESECAMRLNPVTKQYLDRFIYQYTRYVGGAWGCWL